MKYLLIIMMLQFGSVDYDKSFGMTSSKEYYESYESNHYVGESVVYTVYIDQDADLIKHYRNCYEDEECRIIGAYKSTRKGISRISVINKTNEPDEIIKKYEIEEMK